MRYNNNPASAILAINTLFLLLYKFKLTACVLLLYSNRTHILWLLIKCSKDNLSFLLVSVWTHVSKFLPLNNIIVSIFKSKVKMWIAGIETSYRLKNKHLWSHTTPSIHHGDKSLGCHFEFSNKRCYPIAMVWYCKWRTIPLQRIISAMKLIRWIRSIQCNCQANDVVKQKSKAVAKNY